MNIHKQMREVDLTTKQSIRELRKAFDKAVSEKKYEFNYQGADFPTGYARYLLSFYESHLIHFKS